MLRSGTGVVVYDSCIDDEAPKFVGGLEEHALVVPFGALLAAMATSLKLFVTSVMCLPPTW